MLKQINLDHVKIDYYKSNLNEFLKEIRKCDIFLGMKFHSIIFVYYLNMSFIPIVYHNKIPSFLNDINFSKQFSFNIQDLIAKNIGVLKIIKKIFSENKNFCSKIFNKVDLKTDKSLFLNNFLS